MFEMRELENNPLNEFNCRIEKKKNSLCVSVSKIEKTETSIKEQKIVPCHTKLLMILRFAGRKEQKK